MRVITWPTQLVNSTRANPNKETASGFFKQRARMV